MTTGDTGSGAGTDAEDVRDVGLLAPVRAGAAAEAATGDRAFLQAMLDAEAALTRAQAALGRVPARAGEAVTAAARAGLYDVRDLALRARSGGNPVIPLVADLTAAVERGAGGTEAPLAAVDAAAAVHRGATSQDILDTAAMLVASRTLRPILSDLGRTASALARLAADHRDTPMPGRTLTQHAVPTTFGLKAAGWRSLALDAHARLAALRLPAQLGGAAGTLAAFAAEDPPAAPAAGGSTPPSAGAPYGGARRDDARYGGARRDDAPDADPGLRLLAAYAAEVGLDEPALPWHTLRTPVADLASALAFCTGALGKMAADVLVLSRTEIGEVAEGSGGGSSAMPHKSNPVRATLIAAAARQAPALAGVLYGSLSAEDERPAGAWHAEWQALRDLLRLAGGAAEAAAELAAGLRVFPQRMREHLDLTGGLIISERIAAALAPAVGRARARELLTAASRRATAEAVPLAEALAAALADEPDARALLTTERLRELADPTGYLGSAPALVDRTLAAHLGAAHDGSADEEAADEGAADERPDQATPDSPENAHG